MYYKEKLFEANKFIHALILITFINDAKVYKNGRNG